MLFLHHFVNFLFKLLIKKFPSKIIKVLAEQFLTKNFLQALLKKGVLEHWNLLPWT